MREIIRDWGRLEHIIEQINNIEEFVANKSLKDLENDKILQYAVIKCIEIIGEASYMLTNDFRNTHKEVEWEEIIRMRHVLVHGYYHISVMMIWEIIQSDLHKLKQQILEYLKWNPNCNHLSETIQIKWDNPYSYDKNVIGHDFDY